MNFQEMCSPKTHKKNVVLVLQTTVWNQILFLFFKLHFINQPSHAHTQQEFSFLNTYPNNPKATTLSWSIILAPAIFCKVILPSEAIIQLENIEQNPLIVVKTEEMIIIPITMLPGQRLGANRIRVQSFQIGQHQTL